MPLRWKVLHDQKLVHIVAEGVVTRKDLEDHFDALVVEEALEYGKLFDARQAEPVYSDDDVLALGARLSAYTATMKSGPLAVIGGGEMMEGAFRRFVNISPSRRPARLFSSETDARAWLKAVADQVSDQRGREHFG